MTDDTPVTSASGAADDPSTPEFWDARYGESDRLWSGEPNPQLVAEIAEVEAGTAVDIGCGEGADAIWLARRGWRVTGADISSVALERARAHADQAGVEVEWVQTDLLAWQAPADGFDLVNVQFFQLAEPERTVALRRFAAAVAPGGLLLVVAHHPVHAETGVPGPPADRLYTPEDVTALFAAPEWETVTAETRTRTAAGHHSGTTEFTDSVVLLRRAR